ncbi:MAG: HlyD family efflux transporter periplasmic adaptor subunit [Eubacteriaceae bacterium]|nr:HlyD family efflux transporter periplasmic adaptor subunit [Eubacteriaceae bacterium]
MKKKKKKPIILIYILVLIALYLIIYVVPKVTGVLEPTYNVSYGEMKISDTTTGYLVRNEKVYVSQQGGEPNYYVKDGTLMRRNTTVMEVNGGSDGEIRTKYQGVLDRLGSKAVETSDFTVKNGGVVCYYADGYEGKLTPKNMKKKKQTFFQGLSQDNVVELKRKQINAGEPVFKIVDRTNWYIVCYVDKTHKSRYPVGKEVSVEFEDKTVKATVYARKTEGEFCRVILSTDHFYSKYGQIRVAENIKLVTYENRGLLIENKSIVKEKGQVGVYEKDKLGNVFFVPIKVIKSDGEMSLVYDTRFYDSKGNEQLTVEIYDVVLRNPKNKE